MIIWCLHFISFFIFSQSVSIVFALLFLGLLSTTAVLLAKFISFWAVIILSSGHQQCTCSWAPFFVDFSTHVGNSLASSSRSILIFIAVSRFSIIPIVTVYLLKSAPFTACALGPSWTMSRIGIVWLITLWALRLSGAVTIDDARGFRLI